MFLLRHPSDPRIATFIESRRSLPFSYKEVGATQGTPPSGYRLDHNRIRLGEGPEIYTQACAGLKAWQQFDLGWIRIRPENAPIAVGSTVAVLAHHLKFWSLNASRIVYVIEDDGSGRFGFAYGTLTDHAESGEERFTVEWNLSDDSVWYDILAFSRPNQMLAKLGYPLTRTLQRRFAGDSLRRMAQLMRAGELVEGPVRS